ncbi:protein phosphatase 2C domain-containing protein [Frankia sp. AgKG'84/4]
MTAAESADRRPHHEEFAARPAGGPTTTDQEATDVQTTAQEATAAQPAGPAGEDPHATACSACGATVRAQDRFCERCGAALPRAGMTGDRVENDLGSAAGVSDRGLVHRTNEDGLALRVLARARPVDPTGPDARAATAAGAAAGPAQTAAAALAVVCDGVSTAPGSGPAAAAAAAAAAELLVHVATTLTAPSAGRGDDAEEPDTAPGAGRAAADQGDEDADGPANVTSVTEDTRPLGPRRHPTAPPGGSGAPWQPSALRAAAAVAHRSVLDAATLDGDSPACTFVAAIVTEDRVSVGWLGDSRVYLLDQAGARQLTEDDTLSAAAVRAGLLPPEQAETGPGAHTITQWIGSGSSSTVPQVISEELSGPGRVIVCSDGLWNYVSAAGELAARIAELPPGASALAVARHLTTLALTGGGADNISVIVIDLPANVSS